jgi:7-cyano-7-deazaguanine synthase
VELDAARRVAERIGVERQIELSVDLTQWGGSALTGDSDVPESRRVSEIGKDIPITYVPARNTILLALAMGWAETLDSDDVFIGAHTLDYSGYPDCRPEYFREFEQMANLATKRGVEGKSSFRIHAPLVHMSKTDIVRRGNELNVPFELTSSCYQPTDDGSACGVCDACTLRYKAFRELGMRDPLPYAKAPMSE